VRTDRTSQEATTTTVQMRKVQVEGGGGTSVGVRVPSLDNNRSFPPPPPPARRILLVFIFRRFCPVFGVPEWRRTRGPEGRLARILDRSVGR
jgi:hypothetical protein